MSAKRHVRLARRPVLIIDADHWDDSDDLVRLATLSGALVIASPGGSVKAMSRAEMLRALGAVPAKRRVR